MIRGVDVSNHQRAVDWAAVAGAGVRFGIAKATEGTGFQDSWFVENWEGMRRHGLVRGAYHYARPGATGPEEEADFFLSIVINDLKPGDLLALDMEDPAVPVGVGLADWSLRWLERVRETVGFRPLFYTYPSYIREHTLADPRLAEYGLWYASYQATFPPTPAPWPLIAIWQYDHAGAVPGVAGPCDVNWFNGDDIAALRAYGKPGTAAAPTDPTDALLEAAWLAHRAAVGEKLYAATLDRPYTAGPIKVLVCQRGIITPAGVLDAVGVREDLESYWGGHNVLTRH